MYQSLTVDQGFKYLSKVSLQVREALGAAEWLANNTDLDASVAIDGANNWVYPVPGFDNWGSRTAMNVYQIVFLALQPRYVDYIHLIHGEQQDNSDALPEFDYVLARAPRFIDYAYRIDRERPKALSQFDYLFGVSPRVSTDLYPFEVVWDNGDYILYRLQ
jgi:hypothetical protein